MRSKEFNSEDWALMLNGKGSFPLDIWSERVPAAVSASAT